MDRVSTANRLKYIMKERNLKQVDILNLSLPICAKYNIKMNKSDISQYVSGKVEPSQEKLVVLGMALNVTESWLMGFDVSPERKDAQAQTKEDFDILYKFNLLDERDKKIVRDMINSMLTNKLAEKEISTKKQKMEIAEEIEVIFPKRFTDVEKAKKYLRSQPSLAAFGYENSSIPDADYISMANAIYENNKLQNS